MLKDVELLLADAMQEIRPLSVDRVPYGFYDFNDDNKLIVPGEKAARNLYAAMTGLKLLEGGCKI